MLLFIDIILIDAAEEEGETYGRDSDGDGLLDGQEIIRQDTERGYFVLNSDPNVGDTDLDTLYDNEDPEPLIKNIIQYSISDEEYIKISGNSERYGGNQGWFSMADSDFNVDHINEGGCGIISGSDLLLYLQRNHIKFLNITDIDTEYNSKYESIKYTEYEEFVKLIAKYYIPPFDVTTGMESLFGEKLGKFISDSISDDTGTWGVSHYIYMLGIDRYLNDYSNIDVKLRYTYLLNGTVVNDLAAYLVLALIDSNLASQNIDIAIPNASNLVSNNNILNTNKNEILNDIEGSLKKIFPYHC